MKFNQRFHSIPLVLEKHNCLRIALITFGLLLALAAGIQLREWTWRKTTHLRFQRDIVNGFFWGNQTLVQAGHLSRSGSPESWSAFFRGYLALYPAVKQTAQDKQYHLDYPPLRLLVMSLWAKQVRKQFPGAEDGKPEYVEPLLRFNLVCEIASAIAMFLIVRQWLNRQSRATVSRLLKFVSIPSRGWICGIAAALAAWLDPSLILDAHGWPQWDVWILPFYLFAALAAINNRWFWCGLLLAVGAMFKGQLLLVTPFFFFWPCWQRRWIRAAFLLGGFVFGTAAVASPWLLDNPLGWIFFLSFTLAAWAGILPHRPPHPVACCAGIAGVSAFLAGAVSGGSFAWLQVGFLYGSEHYPLLFISSCYNLPALLSDFGWTLKDPIWTRQLAGWQIAMNLQWILRSIYLGALVVCALGAARHSRNRDPRLLVALAAPWLLMFAILGQMHERYLLWGGVVSALALGVNVRTAALNFILSAASTAMIAHVMLIDKKLHGTVAMIDLLNWIRPLASWVVLGCIGAYVWDALYSGGPLFRTGQCNNAKPVALNPISESS